MKRIGTSSLLVAIAVFGAATGAIADDMTITQQDKAFSEKKVNIQIGDSITFVNNDSVTHNVYARTKGNRFDSGAQVPNSSMTQMFLSPGQVKVRCAIHPRMKLTVNVE